MQILILISFCFSMFVSAEASFRDDVRSHFVDKEVVNIDKCIDTLNLFVNSFNDKQKSLVLSSIAENQTKLRNYVVDAIQTRNVEYLFYPYPLDNGGIEIMPHQAIKFMGSYELKEDSAYGHSSRKGFSNYFILEEKDDGNWLIVDSNFHTKLDGDYYYIFILFIFFLFHVWMLIDCFNRKFQKRGVWFCTIIFLPLVGFLLYFFCVKFKQWDNQPDYYEKYLQNDVYSKQVARAIRNNWFYLWTLSLFAMIASVGIPHTVCNGIMLDIITSIKNLLPSLPIIYIFSFIFAYIHLGTVAISFSLWGIVFMILFRVWEYGANTSNIVVFVVIIAWLLWLFLVSYRLLRLNEAVQDRKNLQP